MLRIFGYITYYLLLLLSRFLIISYIRTTEITAEGRRTPMHNIGAVTAVMADALLKDTRIMQLPILPIQGIPAVVEVC